MLIIDSALPEIDLRFEDGEKVPESVQVQIAAAQKEYERWTATPPAPNELARPNKEWVPFPTPYYSDNAYKDSYDELSRSFRERFPGATYLNAATGLPGYMFCDYSKSSWQGDDPRLHAEALMQEFTLTLSGRLAGEVVVSRYWDTQWNGVFKQARQLCYRQEKVLGGFITFTFDSNQRLVLVTNSLYPVSLDELTNLEQGAQDHGLIEAILASMIDGMNGVPENIGFSGLEAFGEIPIFVPYRPRGLRIGKDHLWENIDGEWRVPMLDAEAGATEFYGEYRPAYWVRFVDSYGQPWHGWVDVVKYGLLLWRPARQHALKDYAVFANTQDAIAFEPVLAEGNSATIQQWIQSHGLIQSIWLGTNVQTLRGASRVHMDGDRLKDPQDPIDHPVPDDRRERYLAASVMYHAKKMQLIYRGFMSQADISGWLSDQSNPLNHLLIELEDVEGRPYYDNGTGEIRLSKGKGGTFPVREPGYDGEVVAHELTHAIMRSFFGRLFVSNGTEEQEVTAGAFDEGLAFYVACDYIGNARWAEYAYAAWQVWRDIDATNLSYDEIVALLTDPAADSDPAGVIYGIGMWWARVLWEFRQQFPSFNLVLLRVLNGLSSIQPTTQTATAPFYEQIRSAFRVVGAALRDHLVQDSGDLAITEAVRSQALSILLDAGIEPL